MVVTLIEEGVATTFRDGLGGIGGGGGCGPAAATALRDVGGLFGGRFGFCCGGGGR